MTSVSSQSYTVRSDKQTPTSFVETDSHLRETGRTSSICQTAKIATVRWLCSLATWSAAWLGSRLLGSPVQGEHELEQSASLAFAQLRRVPRCFGRTIMRVCHRAKASNCVAGQWKVLSLYTPWLVIVCSCKLHCLLRSLDTCCLTDLFCAYLNICERKRDIRTDAIEQLRLHLWPSPRQILVKAVSESRCIWENGYSPWEI